MVGLPVLSAKLTLPVLPDHLLTRSSVMARLAAWRSHRLTVVTAPAGYGKTTLAAQLLQQTASGEYRALWLAIDTNDDDPTQFLACIAAALAPLIPTATDQVTSLINRNLLRQALQQLLSALDAIPQSVLFVLDDLHRVHQSEVHHLLAYAVERSPAHLHWLVLTRHTTAALSSKLRLQGQLLEVEMEDLRLSPEEIQTLATSFTAAELDAATLAALSEQTQGWVTGVQLALLSLRRFAATSSHPLGMWEHYSHWHGNNRLLVEYVTAEVLAQLDAPLRTFLLKTAILERLHPALCNAVAGIHNSRHLLERAVAEQLFVRPLDAHGEWYEMHHLLRALLVDALHREQSPEDVQALYRAAADWHLAQGNLANALAYLVDGQAASLAGALLETRSRAALLQNQLAELRHWYSLLPAAQIDSRPQLLLDWAWLGISANPAEAIASIARAEMHLGTARRLTAEWQDELAVLRLLARLYNNEHQNLYADAETTLAQLAPSSHLAYGWCLLMLAIVASNHAVTAVTQAQLEAAAVEFRAANFNDGVYTVLAVQATQQKLAGEAQASLATCQTALALAGLQANRLLDHVCFFHGIAGHTLYLLDQPERAALHFQRILEDAPYAQDACYLRLWATLCLQLCAIAQGEAVTVTAQQRAEELALWQQYAPESNPISRSNLIYWQMKRWLALGDPASAWAAFERMGVTLETLASDATQFMWLTLLTAYLAAGRELAAVGTHLDRIVQSSRRAGQLAHAIEAQTLLVLQQQAVGRHHAARSTLRQVVDDVERTGYVRLLLDQPALAPKLKQTGSAFGDKLAAQMASRPASAVADKLTVQETIICQLLVQGRKPAEIAAELVITEGTVRWHMTNLYAKLGVKNQRQLIAREL
ncbi:MAG: LuxR C-terminal-related transcriptional regulator [Caldilinea sp.]